MRSGEKVSKITQLRWRSRCITHSRLVQLKVGSRPDALMQLMSSGMPVQPKEEYHDCLQGSLWAKNLVAGLASRTNL